VSQPAVSLVIPVYNGEAFLGESLERIEDFHRSSELDGETVVVDDGSTDGTPEILAAHTGKHLSTQRLPTNRGKFAALRTGMAAARGACRVFTDADLPYGLDAIPVMSELVTAKGFHIVVGDRTLAESELHTEQPGIRRISTRAFSFAVRMLVTGELFDTQVGLKAFRGDVAEALFGVLTDDGFAGDVELLYIALKYNLAIRRIPVRLVGSGPSTVSVVGHSLPMLQRIAGLRRGWRSGRYESAKLRSIARQRYWQSGADG
jgi:glycosyltransferase involved in cell wall biosynthesis